MKTQWSPLQEEAYGNIDTPLGFGKYRHETPREVFNIDPGYLVWAYDNTQKVRYTWAFREAAATHEQEHPELKAAVDIEELKDPLSPEYKIALCEKAVLDAYGHFPKPNWIKS